MRVSFLAAAALSAVASLAADDRVERLSEDERFWLEAEVSYIITPDEREVFLNLTTQEERELFIQAFWDRRDPDPATLKNEFMDEHYRRFEYAISRLGRESTRPGWRTDRGRMYIILGEPQEVQRYEGLNEVVSSELWLYTGDPGSGLPPRFNLLFFRENDTGEYRLYHPWADGPEALLHAGFNFRSNQHAALDIIEVVSADLARASMTIDLSDLTGNMFFGRNSREPLQGTVRPSMSVDRNLNDIENHQINNVETDYLEGYLKYGNRVSADYSFNYVSSKSAFAVLVGRDRTPFVHYSIEIAPEHLTLAASEDETAFFTTLEVNLELRTPQGQLLAVTENVAALELSRSEFESASSFPFAYRDSFPVLPGAYQVSIVLRNRATKEYTVAETIVSVPDPETATGLGTVLLASGLTDALGPDANESRTFRLGTIDVDPVTESVFTTQSSMSVALQVLTPEEGQTARLSLLSEGRALVTEEREVLDMSSGAVGGELSLMGVVAGDYSLRVELLAADGTTISDRELPLAVSPRTSIPRPAFVYRHSFSAHVPGLLDMTLGEQLMSRGEFDLAETRLRRAVAADNPRLPMARWKLASVLLFKREADEALEILKPLEADHPRQVEVVEGLGFAYYLKEDFVRAAGYLETARTLRPADTSLLNALGDCYEQQQELDKAKALFEESLRLNPGQEGVKARLGKLG